MMLGWDDAGMMMVMMLTMVMTMGGQGVPFLHIPTTDRPLQRLLPGNRPYIAP